MTTKERVYAMTRAMLMERREPQILMIGPERWAAFMAESSLLDLMGPTLRYRGLRIVRVRREGMWME